MKPSVLVIGIGEYVSGYVHGSESDSDKPMGVVGLCLFDLKRRGKIDQIFMSGTSDEKWNGIRQHFTELIGNRYREMDVSFEEFPKKGKDVNAYIEAMDTKLAKGDCVLIFTPDRLHFEMAKEALKRGLHVLVAKPLVQSLKHHLELNKLAEENDCILAVEVHKRWDPMYSDAWYSLQQTEKYGDFSFFQSYMSQPTEQLLTFKDWAKNSDISYYLNSHHVDFHCWILAHCKDNLWKPISVTASGSRNIAQKLKTGVEYDSITLLVQWQDLKNPEKTGTATYTSSWISQKKGDVHSQQRFFYQGTKSEIQVDQAHRGYTCTTQDQGYKSRNPLFMKYSANGKGYFDGQSGYGYKSLELFIDAASSVNAGEENLDEVGRYLASARNQECIMTTTILEAGKKSLDQGKMILIKK